LPHSKIGSSSIAVDKLAPFFLHLFELKVEEKERLIVLYFTPYIVDEVIGVHGKSTFSVHSSEGLKENAKLFLVLDCLFEMLLSQHVSF